MNELIKNFYEHLNTLTIIDRTPLPSRFKVVVLPITTSWGSKIELCIAVDGDNVEISDDGDYCYRWHEVSDGSLPENCVFTEIDGKFTVKTTAEKFPEVMLRLVNFISQID